MTGKIYEKVCSDCGKVFYADTKYKRKCPKCIESKRREYRKKQREQYKKPECVMEKRKAEKPAERMIINQKQCKTCLYRWQATGSVLGCDYLELVGHMRPSEPSPNCTCYEKYNAVERSRLVSKQKRIYMADDNDIREFRAYRSSRR